MKLNKSDTYLGAEFLDNPILTDEYKTHLFVESGFTSRCRLEMWKDHQDRSQATIADLNKGQVEQLIYVLTLARNRME